ncbi:cytochrome P450 family protein [Streptomyces clavuligerus]|uniref:Cytochrome P450 n=1 Tax=Streptomyces clavuligerus TaxID=1901 RepID=E2Q524_STRCL|nr:cytochrome P450 [Streptomyces clavuligerus]ANW21715.1 cytochrome [Streptomyces clavuligerus]AXU16344.1 cytochrome P450 [Streptomyces clavuligerus]EFG05094.1 Cytochrome P450 [Streptomyces clavuligerus]MBY6306507.1 cytochrome P450 [Streptomyces clavuligerus]QCS09124.1 cytochrome P450 [Streptomyces clavuligerus]
MTAPAPEPADRHAVQPPHVLDPAARDRAAEDAALRARGSVTRVDVLGEEVWAITDPVLLKRLLLDGRVSKDSRRHWDRFPEHTTDWPLVLWVAVESMFTAYGPEHRRLRRLIAPVFTARTVNALAPDIERFARELLDDLATTPPGGTADLRERFANPLPLRVIGRLMGLPERMVPDFRRVVDGVFATAVTAAEAAANTRDLYRTVEELIALKRERPGDDLTSRLIAARDTEGDGQGLSEKECGEMLLLIISAGYETTVNLIDQAVVALLTHPGERAAARAGTVSWGDVVEETLRWQAPVPLLPMRYAIEDIELPGGTVVRRGQAILAAYSAANRHPGLHGPTAGEFDPARADKSHLSFGHGVHVCLGAPLARLEATIALRLLDERFPRLALAVPPGDLVPLPSFLANGHRSVPVVLEPGAPA